MRFLDEVDGRRLDMGVALSPFAFRLELKNSIGPPPDKELRDMNVWPVRCTYTPSARR